MPFVGLLGIAPFLALGVWVLKKVVEIFQQGRLVVLGDQEGVACKRFDGGASLGLGMHGISTDQTSFDQGWVKQGSGSTAFIFLGGNGSLGEHNPALTIIEGEQMH